MLRRVIESDHFPINFNIELKKENMGNENELNYTSYMNNASKSIIFFPIKQIGAVLKSF